jgi:hypothetical protein
LHIGFGSGVAVGCPNQGYTVRAAQARSKSASSSATVKHACFERRPQKLACCPELARSNPART